MRSRILIAALLAILAVVLSGYGQGVAKVEPELILPKGCTHLTSAEDFRPFAAEVWKTDRWRRGEPKKATLAAMRLRKHCAISRSHRAAMRKMWRKAKIAYYDIRDEKMKALRVRQAKEALISEYEGTLAAIRACESGGDYGAVSLDGTYRGAYQFDYGTWASMGGSGDPAAASKFEQDYRAALLYSISGSSPWPVCGV